jgi:uncharacterized protein (DUF2141 family)
MYAQVRLEVTVSNLRDRDGSVIVALFDSEEKFLKNAVAVGAVRFKGDTATIVFHDLAPGEYALSTFHDQNDNKKLDTNVLGIPTEGFGFSNKAMGVFGPPTFRKAKIVVKQGTVKLFLKPKHF